MEVFSVIVQEMDLTLNFLEKWKNAVKNKTKNPPQNHKQQTTQKPPKTTEKKFQTNPTRKMRQQNHATESRAESGSESHYPWQAGLSRAYAHLHIYWFSHLSIKKFKQPTVASFCAKIITSKL